MTDCECCGVTLPHTGTHSGCPADYRKPKLVCPICKKTVDGLYPYHDRKHYYSGQACSDQCAQSLPGQGDMWNYEPEHGEDDEQ